jgi:hypothetical protein
MTDMTEDARRTYAGGHKGFMIGALAGALIGGLIGLMFMGLVAVDLDPVVPRPVCSSVHRSGVLLLGSRTFVKRRFSLGQCTFRVYDTRSHRIG